jgi:transposase
LFFIENMGKGCELSEGIRGQIVLLHSQGESERNIAKTIKCSRGAVQLTLKRHKTTGCFKSKRRTGRKKKTTAREDRILSRMSLKNRRRTSHLLSHDLEGATGTKISARTTRRRLTECGIKACKPRKKPWVSEKNMKKRLEWAKRHKDWTSAEWSKVIWSDESNFEVRKNKLCPS